MAVTLGMLYDKVKNEEEIQLVAGEKGLEKMVRWVHMVEGTDISSFLEGDEVAFTTGIALNSQEELYELVKFNYKQKAVGMVINVGPYISEIPQEVLDFGNQHDFPIFEVPWRVHMANLLRYARRYFNSWGQKAAVWELDENLVFFFANCKAEKVKEEMEKFWKETEAFLLPGAILYAGVGRATQSMHCIGKSFVQAEKIKKLQKKKQGKNIFTTYNELGIYKLLLSMEDTETMQEYYRENLGRLEEYDHINETDYFYFLKQYFELGCSVQDIAAKMYIHRNSVTYKLHKIEEILGMDISRQENRTILMVGFMIKEIIA